jgi:hypothetical protein|tara:strand:+ start:188 stop:484 length:297 start_codon:yes stop_codon:yes gene_type:complete
MDLTTLTSLVTNNSGMLFTGGAAGMVLWVLKKVPNDQIKNIVETFFFGLGRVVTLGMAKWKVTRSVWNKAIEPWLIDLVDNVVGGAVNGFIKGLRIDD